MTAWGVTVGAAVLLLGVTACGGGSDAGPTTTRPPAETTTTSTVPERAPSTTTTMYDPAAVEGQVEAAYLASWEVYADAVYNLELDEDALAEVYAEDYLVTVREEILKRIEDGRAAHVAVEHDYSIQIVGPATAVVVDNYRNHQVLIDPVTKAPTEADPDAEVVDVVTLKLIGGRWRVTLIEELQ